jgi:hypothetical protein
MRLNQAKLRCGNFHQVTWIDSTIEEFYEVRFRGDDRWWLIERVYWPILEKCDIKCDWKVGGL